MSATTFRTRFYFGGNKINDNIEGSFLSGADHLFGMGGDDTLIGYGGNDYLEGVVRALTLCTVEMVNDTFFIVGSDNVHDVFYGEGGDEDKIQGDDGDTDIRLHTFNINDHSVEIINGGGGN